MEKLNVAFKVTWVYGKDGPFRTPCTAEGRKINIEKEKKVWCSQPENECRQLYDLNSNKIVTGSLPCYDSAIFKNWRFSAGIYHHGVKKGQPIPIRKTGKGKWAFFTSKKYGEREADRRVIGCFQIDDIVTCEDGTQWVEAKPKIRYRVQDFDKAPRFWDYHTQEGPPKWGTGLFRYLNDKEAEELREAVLKAAGKL